MKSFLFSIILLTVSTLTYSQSPWNLTQCIEYALENNIQVKQQELNVKMSENQLKQAKYSAFPNLNASANHNYSFGRAIDYGSNIVSQDLEATSFSINSSVSLFNGFQIANTKKQEQLNLSAALSDVEKLKNNIALNIAAAYLQILFNEEMLETAESQKELTLLQVERTRQLVRAGSLPERNLLEIEAQLASDEMQIVNAQNQLELSYLTLTQLLEIKTPEGFTILKPDLSDFSEEIPADSPLNVFEQAQQILPQIQGATLRLQSAQKNVDIAEGGKYPRLSLSTSYSSGARRYLKGNPLGADDPFMEQIRDNTSATIGLSMSIPIFNGWQVQSSISSAKINLENAQLNLELEKNALYKDIQQAYADAMAAQKKYDATEKNVDALQETFRSAEQQFNIGLVNSVEYTTSKTRLNQAQADLISAKYEFIFKSKILEFYQGQPLNL
ncbi:MAG: TolC family protein [Bacteroidales bacterium]